MGFMQSGRVAPSSAPASKVRERAGVLETNVTVRQTMVMHEEAARLHLQHPIEAAEQLWGGAGKAFDAAGAKRAARFVAQSANDEQEGEFGANTTSLWQSWIQRSWPC